MDEGERAPGGRVRCLVLGGSGGVGRAVCEVVAAEGARLALTYHTQEREATELGARLGAAWVGRLDLTSVADVDRCVGAAVAALGGLDALVQCAGVAVTARCGARHQTLADIDEAGWDRLMDTNVKGTYFAVRAAHEAFRRAGGGNVVFVGSMDGVKPVPSPVHYATSKAALSGLAQSLAKELGRDRVRVTVVAPGILEGGVSRDLPDELRVEYLKHCGFKRVGRFDEVARLVAWLALRNTYVTGQTILLDGGL